jgi:hypothetical protein
MRRYYYSFYYAEGPLRGNLITTINFIVRGFFNAEFMAKCYSYCLALSSTPYYSVNYEYIKSENYERW